MDVLIIDDSKTMQLRLRRLLEQEPGVTASTCGDPLVALIEARTCAFDLVLVDQHMPAMDGTAFIRELRAIPHYAQVPIVMITADACDLVRSQALEAGATDFLDKRTTGVELSVRLRNLVRLAGAVRRLDDQASPGLVKTDLVSDALSEQDGTGEADRRVTGTGNVKAFDVTGQRHDGIVSCLERGTPDQFALRRLEERLDHRGIRAIALAGHQDYDAIPS